MAETPWVYNVKARRWQERGTGRFIGPAKLEKLRDGYIDSQLLKTEMLANRLGDGLDLQKFEEQLRQQIKDAYIVEYELAKGGKHNMTQSDYGRIGYLCRTQYQYLHDFVNEIRQGNLSQREIARRAKMYIRSATQAHERAKAAGVGLVLPAYPGDGSTECLSNCRCSWRITEKDEVWECFWTLRVGEHCQTCSARALQWAPLKIEKNLARDVVALGKHLRHLLLEMEAAC